MKIWRCHCASAWLLCVWYLHVAAQERPHCQTDNCKETSSTIDEYFYKINGTKLIISFVEGKFFKSKCGPPLQHGDWPRFRRPLAVEKVTLDGCAPPTDYGAALAALGLRPGAVRDLQLRNLPAAPAPPALDALPALEELELAAAPRQRLVAAALPPQLSRLKLTRVRPPPELPRQLRRLELLATGLETLSLAGLAQLEFLSVSEERLRSARLWEGGALRSLTLDAPLSTLGALPPRLEEVKVQRVSLAGLRAWPASAALVNLTLEESALRELGPRWLAGCPALRRLRLAWQGALRLSPDALRGAAGLRELQVLHCAGAELPPELLRPTPNLTSLALTRNDLTHLPDGLLTPVLGSLQRLDLSGNRLSVSALGPLAAAGALEQLRLNDNRLGDLCADYARSSSPLARLPELRLLGLSGVGAHRLCADWLRLPRLQRLDLTRNNFTELQLGDLVVGGGAEGRRLSIDLSANRLVRVRATEDDYRRARDLPAALQVEVLVKGQLQCDCHMYWTWQALRLRAAPLRLAGSCAAPPARPGPAPPAQLLRPPAQLLQPPPYARQPPAPRRAPAQLADLPPEDFTCVVEEGLCAEECSCLAWPPLGVVAACAGSRLPDLPELVAARLDRLPAALPATLAVVDVRSGNVSISSAEQLQRLAGGGRGVLLAGADLRCGCDVLRAVGAAGAALLDRAHLECSDGRALDAALAGRACDGAAPWGWLLGAAALLLLAPAAALHPRARLRLRIKGALHRRNLHRWVGGGQTTRLFDVFVSHCGADERWVCAALVPALEARGLRACVRARDWPPGAWLPAQLRLSLTASRRVLLVVSRDYTACAWARHELRALCEAEGSLVVLRRDGSPAPPLPRPPLAELRADDPKLWRKLARLLPAPPPPPPPPPAAA